MGFNYVLDSGMINAAWIKPQTLSLITLVLILSYW